MGGLFSAPKQPPLPAPPPVPSRNDAERSAEMQADIFRRRRGRAANYLGMGVGGDTSGVTATKVLLGQ